MSFQIINLHVQEAGARGWWTSVSNLDYNSESYVKVFCYDDEVPQRKESKFKQLKCNNMRSPASLYTSGEYCGRSPQLVPSSHLVAAWASRWKSYPCGCKDGGGRACVAGFQGMLSSSFSTACGVALTACSHRPIIIVVLRHGIFGVTTSHCNFFMHRQSPLHKPRDIFTLIPDFTYSNVGPADFVCVSFRNFMIRLLWYG